MDAGNGIKARYEAFMTGWGAYVEEGYGEPPSMEDYADALVSVTATDPVTVFRGMAVDPGWGKDPDASLPLGLTWTRDRATAMQYAGAPGGGATLIDGHVAVLLTGIVALSDIEIDETVANHLVAAEGEVTLSEDANIRLVGVEGLDIHPSLIGGEHPAMAPENQGPALR